MSEQRPLTAREFRYAQLKEKGWADHAILTILNAELHICEFAEAYHRAALSAESAELRKRMQAGLEAHRDFSEGNGGRE